MARSIHDVNRVPTLIGVSSTDGATPLLLEIDPATGRLLVNAAVTITGLPTAVTDNEAVDVADTGNLALGTDGSNYQVISVDSSGNVQVDIVSSASIAVTNAGITTIAGAITGTEMQVDVLTMPTVAVTGTFYQTTQPVSIATMPSTPVTGTFWQTTQPVSAAGLTALNGAITGTEVQVDVLTMPTVAVTGTFWQTTQPVSLASVPSHAVTNAGTFAVQADTELTTADLDTGVGTDTRAVVGLVLAESGGGLLVGSANPIPVSLATVPSHAVTNAGTFVVQATLAAETTKVIGTINVAASQTIAVTNAGTFATQATLQTGSAAIGKLAANSGVDIGDVDVTTLPAITIAATQTLATVTTVGAVTAITNALPAGTNAIGKLAANSGVDIGDVDVTSVIPGVGATNLGKAIDTALGATDTGVLALAVRDDTLNIRSGTENDVEPLHTDVAGALWTDPQGNVAHDAADAGNPVKIGAKAITALSGATMVAAADRTDLYADEDGVLVTKNWVTNNDILVERLSNTDGAATASTVFGATANSYNCITTIVVHNAHATTNGYVDIRDGTAGTVLMTIPLPANGGAVLNFPIPLRQTTANTALAFDVSAAITTVYISFIGYKSKA